MYPDYPLQQEFPAEFAAVRDALIAPLVTVLEAGLADGSFPNANPPRHAKFIRVLTWELVEEHLSGGEVDVTSARSNRSRTAARD